MLNDTMKLQSAKPRLDLRNTIEHKIQFLQQQKFAREKWNENLKSKET